MKCFYSFAHKCSQKRLFNVLGYDIWYIGYKPIHICHFVPSELVTCFLVVIKCPKKAIQVRKGLCWLTVGSNNPS